MNKTEKEFNSSIKFLFTKKISLMHILNIIKSTCANKSEKETESILKFNFNLNTPFYKLFNGKRQNKIR